MNIRHVQDEVALPIVAFQRGLELMTTKVAYESTGEETFENALYDAWLIAARHGKSRLTLFAAVATAYGWTDYTPAMTDDEILKRLLALYLERSEAT